MYFITKNGPKFWPSSLNQSKSREHFYGRFHRPLALLIHHWTLLSSAVQVRSLYWRMCTATKSSFSPDVRKKIEARRHWCKTKTAILFKNFYEKEFAMFHQIKIDTKHPLFFKKLFLMRSAQYFIKMTQINLVSRNQLHNTARSCQHLNFGLSWPG